MLTDWEEPESVTDARDRLRARQVDADQIKIQLGSKVRRSRAMAGGRTAREEYYSWRDRTIQALSKKEEEIRFLHDWIYDRSEELNAVG